MPGLRVLLGTSVCLSLGLALEFSGYAAISGLDSVTNILNDCIGEDPFLERPDLVSLILLA